MRLIKATYKNLSDEKLMQEMQQGKEQAFQELYDRYAQNLHQYFYRRMWKDREKAEDFVHDLFTKLIKNPDSFDTSRSFKTWIFSVANNMTINEYKKQAVRSVVTSGEETEYQATEAASSDSLLQDGMFREALEKEMVELDDKHREVFELRHIQGFSVKEIAQTLGINEGTVKSRVFYAVKQLTEKLVEFRVTLQA
jgi:RNA polymerase sigma factor (sigma-70 family)|tara:strand:- start:14475 stop:15062 length:588 start_codon:yes stop_codon:yes gene_type:complete